MKELNSHRFKSSYSQKFELSQSVEQSIKQANMIQDEQLFKEISFSESSEQIAQNKRYRVGKKNGQQVLQLLANGRSDTISIIQLNGQREQKQQSGSMRINQSKSSKDGDVIKKINMDKIVRGTVVNRLQNNMLQLSSKKIPKQDTELQIMWENNQNKTHRQIMKNCKIGALTSFRKQRYIKKNYQFQQDIIKISQLKIDQKVCNIKGQILFKWDKHVINQKWAKTEMVCIEIHDGSDSVIVAIPQKIMMKKLWELEIGMWVQLYRVQPKQKYPKKVCMLMTQNSQIKIYNKNQIPRELVIQPQKLGLTLRQLALQPIGRVCNVVCLVLQKSQKQFIKSYKGYSLVISKISVYDPIDKRLQHIKLWQQKSDLPFYSNATVYLLRGVQIKQFKGSRQYQACKDFNYRVLTFSAIQLYLRELYEERWELLRVVPDLYHKMRIDQSCHILDRKYASLIKKQKTAISKDGSQTQQKASEGEVNSQWSSQCSKTKKMLKTPQKLDKRVIIVWSQCIIKFINFQIEQNYQITYKYCLECKHKTMKSVIYDQKCTNCNSQKCINIYYIKCQFSDGKYNYLGQINEQTAGKIFAIENQLTKMQFFQQCHINFKRAIIKQIVNVAVRAIIATTKQKINDDIWIYGYYIVDILPFDDVIPQANLQQEENQNKEEDTGKSQKQSGQYQSESKKIVRFLK